MPKDLQDLLADRPGRVTFASPSRLSLQANEEPGDLARQPDLEREYLTACQKLEQLIERKRRSEEESTDVGVQHRELCLIGTRIQREPHDRSHEKDYLAVLQRVKESLCRKIEAEDLKGEFQKLHFELLTFGRKLGFDTPYPAAASKPPEREHFEPSSPGDMNLGDVERQIAELQAQIRSLHDHR